ncbi:MAG TPA: DNA repair protein RadC [Vicinamibacteria bacterium]|nr:DNA repair protein RadC [Vicinamibacteria bacterium]
METQPRRSDDAARVFEAPAERRRVLDLPIPERPRERLALHGAAALSSRELMAVVLGTGSARSSALDLAEALLKDGVRAVAARSLPELQRRHGLGPAKAGRILAALELGARLSTEGRGDALELRSPEDAARHLLPRYSARPVETFGLLALDVRRRLQREVVVSVGCLTSSLVHPREVFAEAVASRAAGLILFHNHPSGDPEPSAEDVGLTRRLAQAGQLMGIEVLDHLVLGAGRFVSLKQRGVL